MELLMERVFISKKGKVYHTDPDCRWMGTTRANARTLGRTVHPLREVAPSEVGRRTPCRVCLNGGESPKRGKGKGND